VKAKSKIEDLRFEAGPAFERLRKLARTVLAVPKREIEKQKRKRKTGQSNRKGAKVQRASVDRTS
jgi:hypothetical protein